MVSQAILLVIAAVIATTVLVVLLIVLRSRPLVIAARLGLAVIILTFGMPLLFWPRQ